MRLPRFTIAGLMGLVVVVAVAALRFASELWAGILRMLTLGVLGAAILAFHERTGPRRSWWRGFALFGWGYVLLVMGPWASEAIAPNLPTTAGLDALSARMHPGGADAGQARRLGPVVLRDDIAVPPGMAFRPDGKLVVSGAPPGPAPEPFRRVGHCLGTLLVACVGGIIGRACHARGERSRDEGSLPWTSDTVP
jgi:hypothetical protein